jgi:hypothetical protein
MAVQMAAGYMQLQHSRTFFFPPQSRAVDVFGRLLSGQYMRHLITPVFPEQVADHAPPGSYLSPTPTNYSRRC